MTPISRWFQSLILGNCMLAASWASPSLEAAPVKIVLLAGTQGHGLGSHEWNAGAALIQEYLEAAYTDVQCVPYFHRQWPENLEELADAKAIVILDSGGGGHPVAKRLKEFSTLMDRGIGLACLHYAVEVPKGDPGNAFLDWLGGYFETFWSVNPHWTAEFKTFPDHPAARGVKPFSIRDEWYFHMRFREGMQGVTPILSAVAPADTMSRGDGPHSGNPTVRAEVRQGVAQHVAWVTERPGGARGFGFTGMHMNSNWANDNFRKVILNGVAWTAGLEIPAGGVPSKAKSPETLHDLATRFEQGYGKLPAQAAATQPNDVKPLYESKVLDTSSRDRMIQIDLPLPPKTRRLYLAVTDQGNQSCDWSDWTDARIVLKDGKEIRIHELEWRALITGYGTIRANANWNNEPMKVAGVVYEHGLGMHASSMAEVLLPPNAARFKSGVAIDDGGMIRGGKPSNAEVKFLVYDKRPKSLPRSAPSLRSAFFDPASASPQKVPVEAFKVPDGMEVQVWATSPMLLNPTNMDTDDQGRIWVTEGVNYRAHKGRRPAGDRVVVLQDTDQDGVADQSHTFVQDPELIAPLGIAVLGNKVVVSQPPHLIVYTDVDGDLKFDPAKDHRENLLTGFFGNNHDHSLHAVVAGPDGQWYFNHGNTGADFTTRDGVHYRVGGPYQEGGRIAGARSDDGRIWTGGFAARMQPDGTGLTMLGHGFRNSYEHCVTSLGDVFQNDNDDPPACRTTWLMEGGFLGFFSRDGRRTWQADRRAGQTTPIAHWRQEDPGTLPPGDVYGSGSPTGIAFYENGALPISWNGTLLSAEAREQVIFSYRPAPEGAGMKMERAEFMKATEGNMFRPSDVLVGADGAIYVADWFDPGVGGHNDRDNSLSGTIYRIAPKGFRPAKPPDQPTPVQLLRNPSPNVRNAGWISLKDQAAAALPEIRKVLHDSNPWIAARAVWLLPFLGQEGLALCQERLQHADPAQRILAFRALRNAGQPILKWAGQLASDPDSAVRREVAVALRYLPQSDKLNLVARLFQHYDGKDRVYLEACGLAAEGAEAAIWKRVYTEAGQPASGSWSASLARIAWRLQPEQALPALKQRALDSGLSMQERKLAVDTIAFTRSASAVKTMESLLMPETPLSSYVTAWLLQRSNGEWKDFGAMELLKKHGIYDPEQVSIQFIQVPEPPKNSQLPQPSEILKLQGNPQVGRQIATACTTCHQIEGQGPDYGPELRGWVASQGETSFLEAVIHPSSGIAHGFDGEVISIKGGGEIHGLVYADGDPLMIRSTGGITQLISRDRIRGRTQPLRRSLMLSADQLGLTPQLLADLTAFFKEYR